MRQIPRGIGEGKNIILVVGEMLKSRIKKMQKECWRNAEKISPLYWALAKRVANSLGAVSTPAEQHNQWTSNQRPFAVFFLMQLRQIYFKIWTNTHLQIKTNIFSRLHLSRPAKSVDQQSTALPCLSKDKVFDKDKND